MYVCMYVCMCVYIYMCMSMCTYIFVELDTYEYSLMLDTVSG